MVARRTCSILRRVRSSPVQLRRPGSFEVAEMGGEGRKEADREGRRVCRLLPCPPLTSSPLHFPLHLSLSLSPPLPDSTSSHTGGAVAACETSGGRDGCGTQIPPPRCHFHPSFLGDSESLRLDLVAPASNAPVLAANIRGNAGRGSQVAVVSCQFPSQSIISHSIPFYPFPSIPIPSILVPTHPLPGSTE